MFYLFGHSSPFLGVVFLAGNTLQLRREVNTCICRVPGDFQIYLFTFETPGIGGALHNVENSLI
jgi:hypothetical protein